MPRITPRLIGDAIQIAASIGMLVALVMLIVEVAGTGAPTPTSADPAASPYVTPLPEHGPAEEVTADRQRELASFVRDNCSLCHGTEGSLGPFLSADNLQHLSENAIALTILHGRQKGMPAWKSQLSEAEARWIAGYLKRDGFTR